MIEPRDDMMEKNLERLRTEVAVLADNLQALSYNPDEIIKDGVKHVDKTTELYLSFWHEPIDPFDPLA